jgi:hypothetical protein
MLRIDAVAAQARSRVGCGIALRAASAFDAACDVSTFGFRARFEAIR